MTKYPTPAGIRKFRTVILRYYKKHGRDLPWRRTKNPYHILVSEVMLQQTQVERVIKKYPEFIMAFPDFPSLKKASLKELLSVWQGMGYNRRAISLKGIATRVIRDFDGILPDSVDQLETLPGIGRATASSICAFAFNKPAIFVETNIRCVFLHFFFNNRYKVKDTDILPVVEKTLDRRNSREWYYALMDYGVLLKRHLPMLNLRSAHYRKQGAFQGSNRQMRGKILRSLMEGPASKAALTRMLMHGTDQIGNILVQLEKEGFIVKKGMLYSVAQ